MDTSPASARKGWIVDLEAPRLRVLQTKRELSDAKKRVTVVETMMRNDQDHAFWAPKLKEAQQWVAVGERRVAQAEMELEEFTRHNAEQ